MMHSIVYGNHPALKQIAVPVDPYQDRKGIIDQMFHLMEQGRGIGLAANQIGVLERIIVMDCSGQRIAIINPEIIKFAGGKQTSKEGCLSFPGARRLRIRYGVVHVTGYDPDWQPISRKFKGLRAFVIQHEIDHLNGRTIMDN